MVKFKSFAVCGCLFATIFIPAIARADDTKPLAFVTDLVRVIATIDRIRNQAYEDSQKNLGSITGIATDCIRNETSLKLELSSEIERLKSMRLASPDENLTEQVANIWQDISQISEKMVSTCRTILESPEDIKAVRVATGESAELGARNDYIDKSIFVAVMPAAMFTLISRTPDSKGHMSILVISQLERAALIHEIDLTFGEKLKAKNPKYLLASVVQLREWLGQKGYTTSD
jgi:hypothetical protein